MREASKLQQTTRPWHKFNRGLKVKMAVCCIKFQSNCSDYCRLVVCGGLCHKRSYINSEG